MVSKRAKSGSGEVGVIGVTWKKVVVKSQILLFDGDFGPLRLVWKNEWRGVR